MSKSECSKVRSDLKRCDDVQQSEVSDLVEPHLRLVWEGPRAPALFTGPLSDQ